MRKPRRRITFGRWADGQIFFTGGPSDEFHRALHRAQNVNSLYSLYHFCRLRFPDFYRDHHPFLDGTGQHQMRRIWSKYLEDIENVADRQYT